MKVKKLEIDKLITERLILIPYTIDFCRNILNGNYRDLEVLNLKKGKSWPDADVLDTLPRIIDNLSKVKYPTGYESWMIIKKDTLEIIGDLVIFLLVFITVYNSTIFIICLFNRFFISPNSFPLWVVNHKPVF